MKTNAELYQERLKRYVIACYNEQPDRIPIRIFSEELSAKYAGYSNFEAAIHQEIQFEANRKFAVEFGCDAIQTNSIVNWAGMIKSLGWKGIKFPGIELPVNTCTQWTEPMTEDEAFMKEYEFDELINDPTAFMLNTWLPRFTSHINLSGEPVTFEHNMSLINGIIAYNQFFTEWSKAHIRLIDSGVVPAVSSVLKAPLDILGDKLRGYMNLVTDLLERREKIMKACEALMPHLLYGVLNNSDPDKNIPSIIWMHRGCIPFISNEDFKEIYWPTLKPIIEELWLNGHQIILYAEGDWTAHLEAFAELPENSIIFHVDKTAILKAHEILGKNFCISGGIPNEILANNDASEVRDYCKKTIDTIARDGGYIMDASALIMDDARVENVREMIDFTLNYGRYSKPPSIQDLNELKNRNRSRTTQYLFKKSMRPPGTCIPWSEKRNDFSRFNEDENPVRLMWEKIDSQGYSFCWTNLTW
jgi:hypothetical protein